MKRIVFAGIAALALTAAYQGTASAGWGFNASLGVSVSGSFNCYCTPKCPPACASDYCGYSYPQAYYDSSAYYAPSSYYAGYAAQQYAAPTTQMQSAPLPQGPVVNTQAGVQPVGYYYYGYNNYGYYQAPSYWYGR